MEWFLGVLLLLILLFVAVSLAKTIRIVPQARAAIVERFGKYRTTLPAGLNIVVPLVDKVRCLIDLRGQVILGPAGRSSPKRTVVSFDTVIFFQVTDAVSATYEIATTCRPSNSSP